MRTYCTEQWTLVSALWWPKWDRNSKGDCICKYRVDSLCCPADTNRTSQSNHVHTRVLSCVHVFVIPWTVAHQAPLSLGFSRQECRSDCHVLLQGISWTQGLNIHLLHLRLADRFFTTELPGKPKATIRQLTKEKKKPKFFLCVCNDISFGISWWLLNWQVSTWQESHRCGFRSQLGVFQQCGLETVLRPLRAWLLMDKKGTIFQGSYGYGCSHLSQNYCDYYYFYL